MCKRTRNFSIEKGKILRAKLQKKIAEMPDGPRCQRLISCLDSLSKTLSVNIYLRDALSANLPLTKVQQHKLQKLKRKSK